jgi:hypothetical protein
MIIEDKLVPVELLRDGRGIYGIGVSELFDDEALAWSCGAEKIDDPPCDRPPSPLILRPDRLDGSISNWWSGGAVLQKITGGFRHGMFSHTTEECLRQFIHHEMLRRAGLCWPPQHPERWWSADKKQQARNRCVYHGLRLCSLSVINNLIGTLLEQGADADAVRAARRFAFRYREAIYRASARGRHASQLTDTFPFLAFAIYTDSYRPDTPVSSDFDTWALANKKLARRKSVARARVERGARLRDVAAAMNIPMALRCISPGAAHLVPPLFCQHPSLLRFMPTTLPRARDWLKLVHWASHKGIDFAAWAACTIPQIPGGVDQVHSFLTDIADWATAADRRFIVRPFVPSMSLKTVTKLSADWHEIVANEMDGPDHVFPPPWYPATKSGAYDILPIDNSAALYREGRAMHHCIGSYGEEIKGGGIYVYSVQREGERVATLALARTPSNGTEVIQLRGPCNAQPSQQITTAVQQWHRALGLLVEAAQ